MRGRSLLQLLRPTLSQRHPSVLNPTSSPTTVLSRFFATVAPQIGYVFDIDGVLLRGSDVLPPGRAAIQRLYSPRTGWRAPVAFLTNGGGHSESVRAKRLSYLLQAPITPAQVILSHTPMRGMSASLSSRASRAVVTVGGPECPQVARDYGFDNVVDIARLALARGRSATPFASYRNALPLTEDELRVARLPVGLALVMHDSGEDFQRDLQLLVDFVEEDPNLRPEELTIVFSNPDIVFPNAYQRPRLAGGTLRVALDAILEAAKGGLRRADYKAIELGKPNEANYAMAEESLLSQLCSEAGPRNLDLVPAADIFEAIYMVGDNPASDVRGARRRGRPWQSILVRTGNFCEDGNSRFDPADHVLRDAEEAVTSTKVW